MEQVHLQAGIGCYRSSLRLDHKVALMLLGTSLKRPKTQGKPASIPTQTFADQPCMIKRYRCQEYTHQRDRIWHRWIHYDDPVPIMRTRHRDPVFTQFAAAVCTDLYFSSRSWRWHVHVGTCCHHGSLGESGVLTVAKGGITEHRALDARPTASLS